MRAVPDEPADQGAFDVVVCGGGLPGCAAALAAAGNGCKVALVHDRLVFGGNASREVGLGARGYFGAWVEKLCERQADGNLAATAMVEAEPNIAVFMNEHITGVRMADVAIAAVEAVNALTGALSVFAGKEFIDCTGRAVLGILSGARTKTGCEARSEFGESLAPEEPSELHHGNTVLYHVHEAQGPVDFPDVPWAKEVARDFAELGGQMGALGEDNQPGPAADDKHAMGSATNKLKLGPKVIGSVKKNHMFPPEDIMRFLPGTHYWEYGQDMDLEANEEEIRDHLMRALFGTLANVRAAQPKKYANLEFEWMHIVPARGEYRRYVGDYAMTENDVRNHTLFDDSIVYNDQAFCIHYGGNEKYDFRLKSWIWDMRDSKPYALPLRCLYSADVPNLLCAGKHISTTRVVGTNVKMMANGVQHGIAAGCAAALCAQNGWAPREIAAAHMDELKSAVRAYTDVPEG